MTHRVPDCVSMDFESWITSQLGSSDASDKIDETDLTFMLTTDNSPIMLVRSKSSPHPVTKIDTVDNRNIKHLF